MNVPSAMSGISVRHRLLTKILRRSRLIPMRRRPSVLANLPVLSRGPLVRPILPVLSRGPLVSPILSVLLPGTCVRVLLPRGTCVRVLLPLGTCVRVLLPLGTCVTVFVPTAVIGLVDFTTLRVVEVGCETLFIVGREMLWAGGFGRAIVRTGAARTTFGFFCSAERLIVPPASFDAAVVCANARGDVCTAVATAKAAVKMINLRMCAPFSFSFSRRARCASANGKTSWMHLNVYTDFRGPRIIAVAGNRGHLWGEQHRIETRTKRNHSRVNSGRLTIGGNYSGSPLHCPPHVPLYAQPDIDDPAVSPQRPTKLRIEFCVFSSCPGHCLVAATHQSPRPKSRRLTHIPFSS